MATPGGQAETHTHSYSTYLDFSSVKLKYFFKCLNKSQRGSFKEPNISYSDSGMMDRSTYQHTHWTYICSGHSTVISLVCSPEMVSNG